MLDPPKSHILGHLNLEVTFILRVYKCFKATVIYKLLVICFKMLQLQLNGLSDRK